MVNSPPRRKQRRPVGPLLEGPPPIRYCAPTLPKPSPDAPILTFFVTSEPTSDQTAKPAHAGHCLSIIVARASVSTRPSSTPHGPKSDLLSKRPDANISGQNISGLADGREAPLSEISELSVIDRMTGAVLGKIPPSRFEMATTFTFQIPEGVIVIGLEGIPEQGGCIPKILHPPIATRMFGAIMRHPPARLHTPRLGKTIRLRRK